MKLADDIIITHIDGVPLQEIDWLEVSGIEPIDPDGTGKASKFRIVSPTVALTYRGPERDHVLTVDTTK